MGGAVRARETWTATVSGHAGIAPHRHDGTGAGKGQQLNVLELAQLAPGELRAMLQPLWGQWQNDTPTLRIPYYRPLDPLQPGFLP